ncbi:MAG: HIT domain-containing protein [Bacteroidota bacterium]
MERLWSPWRSQYIAGFMDSARKGRGKKRCILCSAARAHRDSSRLAPTKSQLRRGKSSRSQDEKNFILWRGKHCFVIMNRYPYNSGHLMVVPYKHVPSLTRLTDDEHLEILHAIQSSLRALESTVSPHGFNIGVNLGRVSGAGINDHVHYHVVPRWSGDTNFMPVFADVKVISEDMKKTWKRLKNAMKNP